MGLGRRTLPFAARTPRTPPATESGRGPRFSCVPEGAPGQATTRLSASPRAPASSALSSTTRRPPPSSGTRITMPRPSLVTSSGPSPVRGFIAAMRTPLPVAERPGRRTRFDVHYSLFSASPPGDPGNRVRQTSPVHARSALFDLYGDHLRVRDDRAPVAALVRLLASLGIAPPAGRTAISRIVRQGWLEPVRLPAGRGYALTDRARHRLDD